MAINTTTVEANLTTKLNATSGTTDAKEFLLLGKAVEALTPTVTVQSVINEGTTQVSNVSTEGATQVAAVQAAAASISNVITVTAVTGAFIIDGTNKEALNLVPSVTYRFDQSDASNVNHPLRFSTTADGTHASGTEFTTGVTVVGTPGTSGAYTEIIIEQDSVNLFYYCSNHSGMGNTAYSAYNVLSTAPSDGDVLSYSAAAGSYVNAAASGGGGATQLLNLTDGQFMSANLGYPDQAIMGAIYGFHYRLGDPSGNANHTTGRNFWYGGHIYGNSTTRFVSNWYQVDCSTTQGSVSAPQLTNSMTNLWTNTSYGGNSTVQYHSVQGSGQLVAGGNIPIPGYTSHQFSYSAAGMNQTSGANFGATYSLTYADHSINGNYNQLPVNAAVSGNHYMIHQGYYTQQSSLNFYRVMSFNTSNNSYPASNQFSANNGVNSSAGQHINIHHQPGVYPNSTYNYPVGIVTYAVSNGYRMTSVAQDGSVGSSLSLNSGSASSIYNNIIAIQVKDPNSTASKLFLYSNEDQFGVWEWTQYNGSPTRLSRTQALPPFFIDAQYGLSRQLVWTGNTNEFIVLGKYQAASVPIGLYKFTIDYTTGALTNIKYLNLNNELSLLELAGQAHLYGLYGQDGDFAANGLTHILYVARQTVGFTAKVGPAPADSLFVAL